MNEDLVFDLEQPLIIPANNNYQNRGNFKFVVNKTSLDWYNARLSINFKLTKLTGYNVIINDKNGIVNGASSFFKKISFSINGREIYQCNSANHVVNIKNLLEYNASYAESIASNEFYYLDTTNSPNRNKYLTRQVQHGRNNANTGWTPRISIENEDTTYNKGFDERKKQLGNSRIVNCEIPLNWYSFFETLRDKMLPDSRFELNIEFESDNNLIWREGNDVCRVIITKLQLYIPSVKFDGRYKTTTAPKSWTYLNEYVTNSTDLRQREGNFRITNEVSKPHHVFIFIVNSANINSQTANPFLYQTFNVANNRKLTRCYLKANEKVYPNIHYKPSTEPSRVYRDVIKYGDGTLLNRNNFESLFPFIHFELPNLEDKVKLSFHYELSGEPNADYTIFAIVLHEKVI